MSYFTNIIHLKKPTRITSLWFSVGLVSIFLSMSHKSEFLVMEEICDNAIDDDGDGLIDLNDSDCYCIVIEPISFIPNPSFEETDCCPESQSELDCATGWVQASFPTTDFIHLCGWLGWDNESDQFHPPQPFPDGEGIVGFRNGVYFPPGDGPDPEAYIEPDWKEYAGACLLSPLIADSSYRIVFDIGFINSTASPPIQVTIFGTTDCINLPFGGGNSDPLTGCPSNDPNWVEIGSTLVIGGENIWVNTAIDIRSDEDIQAISIGPDCANNLNENNRYYFLDNLILDKVESFAVNITTNSNACQSDFSLEVEDYPDYDYQWYKDGIALIGETEANLSMMYGEGDYQVRTINDGLCVLSGIYKFTIPLISTNVYESMCAGEVYLFGEEELTEAGMYSDTFPSSSSCDTVVYLELDVENEILDTLEVLIFQGQSYEIEDYSFDQPGEYYITLNSTSGCPIEALLIIGIHQLFIPNVFSPNGDGINDKFEIVTDNPLFNDIEMVIYDRWGGIVTKGTSWDGYYGQVKAAPGVYVYVLKIGINDNPDFTYMGTITLLN